MGEFNRIILVLSSIPITHALRTVTAPSPQRQELVLFHNFVLMLPITVHPIIVVNGAQFLGQEFIGALDQMLCPFIPNVRKA